MKEEKIFQFAKKAAKKWLSVYSPKRTRRDYTKKEFGRLRQIARARDRTLSGFPNDIVRQDIILSELDRLKVRGKVADLGCGPGYLTIELLKRNYNALGLDISKEFVKDARRNLIKSSVRARASEVFRVADITRLGSGEKFNAVIALGVVEYLRSIEEFFSSLDKALVKGGYALIECRNKLFNVFSANHYTIRACGENELDNLVKELAVASKYSVLPDSSIPLVQKWVSVEIAKALRKTRPQKTKPKKLFFLTTLTRKKQYTPLELEEAGRKYGLKLDHVIYQHLHCFPPRYEELFPGDYNKMAILMAPLGYTSIGAWSGSSFIAVFRKKRG